MTITFLNVGQGDSIYFEWVKDAKQKFALLDANISGITNPALDYLIKKEISEIEYIILSHPHYDHFSGLKEILLYCDQNSIPINYFLHTAEAVPDFLFMASKSAFAEKELQQLFKTLRDLHPRTIKNVCSLQANHPGESIIPLNNVYRIKVLAPAFDERDRYIKMVPLYNEENPHSSPCANWLSTILKIESVNKYALLTSDANVYTLKKLGRQHSKEFDGLLEFGQSPHHGSKHNHLDSFWKLRKHKNDATIAISVGQNFYGHPDESVINSFKRANFKVKATNLVGGLIGKSNDQTLKKSIMIKQFSQNQVAPSQGLQSVNEIKFDFE